MSSGSSSAERLSSVISAAASSGAGCSSTTFGFVMSGPIGRFSLMIVMSKPYLAEKVTNELLKVEKIKRNPECRNILIGRTIAVLGSFPDKIKKKGKVINFAKRARRNSRPATKKKARVFLKKFG